MHELVAALLLWLGAHSTLAYHGSDLPEVRLVPPSQLAEVMFDHAVPEHIDVERLGVAGLYQYQERIIYLRDDVDLATIAGRAILVHELVHFVQYEAGLPEGLPCKQALEPLAYAAQARYLGTHHVTVPFDLRHVSEASRCVP